MFLCIRMCLGIRNTGDALNFGRYAKQIIFQKLKVQIGGLVLVVLNSLIQPAPDITGTTILSLLFYTNFFER